MAAHPYVVVGGRGTILPGVSNLAVVFTGIGQEVSHPITGGALGLQPGLGGVGVDCRPAVRLLSLAHARLGTRFRRCPRACPRGQAGANPPLADVNGDGSASTSLAYAIFCFRPDMPLPGLWSLLPAGGSALLIAFATAQTKCGKWLGARPLVGVGLVSYSAYLWHQPLFAFARFRFALPAGGWLMLASSAAAFAMAYASWRFVERPFRDRARFSRGSVFLAALATGITLIIVGRIFVLIRWFTTCLPSIEGVTDVSIYRKQTAQDVRDLDPSPGWPERAACQLGRPNGRNPISCRSATATPPLWPTE